MSEQLPLPPCPPPEDLSLYALGLLSGTELNKLLTHLRVCASCRTQAAALRQAVDHLPYGAPPAEPPGGMKQRVLAFLKDRPDDRLPSEAVPEAPEGIVGRWRGRRHALNRETAEAAAVTAAPAEHPGAAPRRWLPILRAAVPLLAVLAIAAAVVSTTRYSQSRQEIDRWKARLTSETEVSARLRQRLQAYEAVDRNRPEAFAAFSLLAGQTPGSKEISLSGNSGGPQGRLLVIPNGQGYLLAVSAEGLPQTQGSQVYQLWLVEGGQPQSGGLFTVSTEGRGLLLSQFTGEFSEATVTLEPDHRATQPKGPRVLIGTR